MNKNKFELVNDESNRLIGWSLLIIGGSLLAVLNHDYLKLDGKLRFIYLLFIVGWVALCISIYYGELVTRNYIASFFGGPDQLPEIEIEINDRFSRQINFFLAGVTAFGIWMAAFLLLWIFSCIIN